MPLQVTGSFTGNGNSAAALITTKYGETRHYNISLSGLTGTGATVTLQRSFDDGATWKSVTSFIQDVEKIGYEPGGNVLYRYACTSYSSGTIVYGLG